MKAKPTRIEKKDQKDSYGNTSYVVTMDNGDSGFYTSKSEDQNKFVVGVEIEYLIEEKIGKTGRTYHKITLPQADQGFQKGGMGRPPQDPRVQMISFSMSYCKDLIVAGKVELKDLPSMFDIIYNEMINKL